MKEPNRINPPTRGQVFRNINRTLATSLLSLSVGLSLSACATDHVMQTLDEVKWGDAPPMLPAGAKIAVLSGNPGA